MSDKSWPTILVYSMSYSYFTFKTENCVYQRRVEAIKRGLLHLRPMKWAGVNLV